MRGAKMVMPGARLDGASVYELLETEKVTMTAAVPTVWLMLLGYMQKEGKRLTTLKKVLIGGSACPPAMIRAFEDDYGVEVRHAWGMTEMSPVGSTGSIKPECEDLSHEELLALKAKQGWAPFGVEMKIVDDENRELPWDGKRFGRLKVAGFAVAKSYFKGEGGEILDEDGFFDTGDVATIDPNGYMQITDRAKDVIKSGGEWISSIDIENLAVGHPDVAEAAVIGIAHPKWDERPLLVVVPKEGKTPQPEEVLGFLQSRIAKWWLPDDMQIVAEIPHTATGKINKLKLRETFKDYRLADGVRVTSLLPLRETVPEGRMRGRPSRAFRQINDLARNELLSRNRSERRLRRHPSSAATIARAPSPEEGSDRCHEFAH